MFHEKRALWTNTFWAMEHTMSPSWIVCTELYFGTHCFFVTLTCWTHLWGAICDHLCILTAELEKLLGVFIHLLLPVLGRRPAVYGTLLPSQRAQRTLLSQNHESALRLPHASKWLVADFLPNTWAPDTLSSSPLLSTQASETCSALGLWYTIPWFFCLPGWRLLGALTYRYCANSSDSLCLVTVPPSLSYLPLQASATHPL